MSTKSNRARLITAVAATLGVATVVVCLLCSREILVHWHVAKLARDESLFLEYAGSESDVRRAAAARFAATERGMRRIVALYLEAGSGLDARLRDSSSRPEDVLHDVPIAGFVMVAGDTAASDFRGTYTGGFRFHEVDRDLARGLGSLAPLLPALHGRRCAVADYPDYEFRFLAGDEAARRTGRSPRVHLDGRIRTDEPVGSNPGTEEEVQVLARMTALVFIRRGESLPDAE